MNQTDTASSRLSPPRAEELLEEERRLHARVVARDERALLESFDRSGHLVFCAALLLSGERSTAEDFTEELFTELWRTPQAFAPLYGPLGLQMIRRLADRIDTEGSKASEPAIAAVAGRSA